MPTTDTRKDDKRIAQEAAELAARVARKRRIAFGSSAAGVIAVAFALALLAVPRRPDTELDGPFVAPLTEEKVQVNLNDGRSYLVLRVNVLYDAPDAEYVEKRTAEPVCAAEVRDTLVALGSAKSREDVTDPALKPLFLEELRRAVEPLLFPVHIGATSDPRDADGESGLRPGLSSGRSSFRGMYGEHVLALDAVARTLQLDGGAIVTYSGSEEDLAVRASDDATLFVDVTHVREGWRGQVQVGARGRVRRMLLDEMLIQ